MDASVRVAEMLTRRGTTRRTPPAPSLRGAALCNEDWARPEVPVTPAASGHFSDAENASGHGAGGGIGRTDGRMGDCLGEEGGVSFS